MEDEEEDLTKIDWDEDTKDIILEGYFFDNDIDPTEEQWDYYLQHIEAFGKYNIEKNLPSKEWGDFDNFILGQKRRKQITHLKKKIDVTKPSL